VLVTDRVPERQAPPTDLARELGLLDGTMIVAGARMGWPFVSSAFMTAAVLVMRRAWPGADRPCRASNYPTVPALYQEDRCPASSS
jgi:hypothetical protein